MIVDGNVLRLQTDQASLTISGGQAIAEMLRLHKVGPIFGMGGFQLLPFYEAVRSLGLEHHLINDERAGAFAADAMARVTGRPAVCDGTLGPGATNLITALAESLNAGVPVIAIVGDTNRTHSWKNMTQECRQVEMLRPAAKDLVRIEIPERIPELIRRAFMIATSGRPGPVVIDVPEDVCHAQCSFSSIDFYADRRATRVPAYRTRPDGNDIEAAARLLTASERPVLLAGGGVHLSSAYETLRDFAEGLAVPVAHTMSGKGALACTHQLSVGLFGRYSRIANDLIGKSDCLIAAGCKLGEIATKRYQLLPAQVPLVHLDIMAEEIGRTAHPTVALWADVQAGLEDLLSALSDEAPRLRDARAAYGGEVARHKEAWRKSSMPRLTSDERPINVARLCYELNRAMPPDSILVADGGFAGHWSALFYDTKRAGRTYIADRGLASIGYGLPGSIGTQLGAPQTPVVALSGDGGLNMMLGELETAKRTGAALTLVVVNNAASGYVKVLQHAIYGTDCYQSSDLQEIDYADVARAMGCHGIRVTDPSTLRGALDEAISERDRPSVVDVVVTRDPEKMLPAADSRTLSVKRGDRPI